MKKTKHGANVNYFAKKYNIELENIVDFSSNINIFTPNISYDNIISYIKNNINKYPDIEYSKLKKSISKIYDIKEDYITVGNGATEIIDDILLLKIFRNIGIFHPTFSEYERMCNIHNKKTVELDINCIENMKILQDNYVVKNLDMLILCNPNNPTGSIYNLNDLIDFCNNNNIVLLVDETFIDFCNNDKYSLKQKIKDNKNIIVISAITKYYAMTGARLGYCFCSNIDINEELDSIKKPWNINVLAESIVYELKNIDDSFDNITKSYYEKETKILYEKYNKLDGVKASLSSSCYICIEFESIDVLDLQKYLITKHNMLIRVLDNYKNISNNSIRIAIKDKQQNDRLFYNIKMYLKGDK